MLFWGLWGFSDQQLMERYLTHSTEILFNNLWLLGVSIIYIYSIFVLYF